MFKIQMFKIKFQFQNKESPTRSVYIVILADNSIVYNQEDYTTCKLNYLICCPSIKSKFKEAISPLSYLKIIKYSGKIKIQILEIKKL